MAKLLSGPNENDSVVAARNVIRLPKTTIDTIKQPR